MTQDEIMFMAMKSGCPKENALANMDILEAFAKLVAAKEREACAKLCAAWPDYTKGIAPIMAERIRARGQA